MLCQQHTLNVTSHYAGSIRDLEGVIVEVEQLNESTGNRGCIEILKSVYSSKNLLLCLMYAL